MARIHLVCSALTTADRPFVRRDYERLERAAIADRFRVHAVEPDPQLADVILFVGAGEPDQNDVRSHHLFKRFPEKCLLFDAGDRPLPLTRGIYASADTMWFPKARFKAGFYLRVFENDAVAFAPLTDEAPLLFSFAGAAANARVRQRLMALDHPRAALVDTSGLPVSVRQTDGSKRGRDDYGARYLRLLEDSKFVLCPRGIGTSSWRLFETMKAGRVPVILSDRWVAPEGPDWSSFALRIPERRVNEIPAILARHEAAAIEMGARARNAWENWFCREVAFHRIAEACLDIPKARSPLGDPGRLLVYPHLARPFFLRHWVLGRARRAVGSWAIRLRGAKG